VLPESVNSNVSVVRIGGRDLGIELDAHVRLADQRESSLDRNRLQFGGCRVGKGDLVESEGAAREGTAPVGTIDGSLDLH
jgi:hypothetical protein